MIRLKLSLILLMLTVSASLGAETVYLQPQEALKLIFKSSERISAEEKTITPEQKKELRSKLGTAVERSDWNFYVATTGSKIDGYAVIDHEIGRMEPITYMTAINPDGSVKAVEILVYRESIGSEVREKKFLRQFDNKNNSSSLRVGQDIQNISGATMSVRGVAQGVKRDLAVWQLFYGGK